MKCRSLRKVGETPLGRPVNIGSRSVWLRGLSYVAMLRTAASCVAYGADEPRTVALSLVAGRPETGTCKRRAGIAVRAS